MKFKILTARSPERAQEEIERFKRFCSESRIKDIRITGGGEGFVITVVYEDAIKFIREE